MYRGDIECNGEKEWSNLIVQLAGKLGALLFLHLGQLLVQAGILKLHRREAHDHLIELAC